MATYEPAGELQNGSYALEEPTEAMLRCREEMQEE